MRRRFVCALAVATSLLTTAAAPSAFAGPAAAASCAPGQVCFWGAPGFEGPPVATFELANADVEQCVSLPEGVDALSFANRMDRYVTMYQSRECATVGDFSTYPGDGVYVPVVPYAVRAFQIWEKP
ncbi:peptidase inhibitor family I36 protein [Embleya sp. NBC_00896]|uniref:peptidase inhibitor family I36 protein n=1 Tax=Embleya sp. NBC_00896 TaxID=2975961 RepID=UPI003864B417|nr:peptidase inhibitor family I36 protein [Embleya sp. NBC_00896]